MIPFGTRSGSAIIIGSHDTALNTARCLADAGIDVHLACTKGVGLARYTRAAKAIDLTPLAQNEQGYVNWLFDYAQRLRHKPMLIPCGDHDAIMIARHRDRLAPVCHLWENTLADLLAIISKDQLTLVARHRGVPLPPTLVSPSTRELAAWIETTAPPYLAKPYYLGIDGTERIGKNRIFESPGELLEFIPQGDCGSLIIQKLIRGGDGRIYDCYGLCGRNHQIVTMATHRRIRQNPRDRGVTCYGEIPARLPNGGDQRIFDLTKTLLSGLRYHGIFGIEWIEDSVSGELFLLDFNARPFITIRHLRDCGLNLPLLAYDELLDGKVSGFPMIPELKHKYWIDLLPDAMTFRELKGLGRAGWGQWLLSIARSRSFAIFSTRDLGPSLAHLVETVGATGHFIWRRLFHRKPPGA
jgi:predicted ATP-grasp superfamily ATP-dependent carboligase